jgi:hypothetical protein
VDVGEANFIISFKFEVEPVSASVLELDHRHRLTIHLFDDVCGLP